VARPQTSTRNLGDLADRLAPWLAAQVGATGAEVTLLGRPDGAGLSSETVLFDLAVQGAPAELGGGYVLRMPPPADAFPLFPRYDLERQVAAMRFVRARSDVPVPAVPWFEGTGDVLGAPFFVMERLEGDVVPDMPPYVFGSWLTDADASLVAAVGSRAVDVLVGIHGAAPDERALDPWQFDLPGATPLERHVANQRRYYDWIRQGASFPLIDATFAWLDARWPADEGAPVLSWGDSRLANVLWRDGAPVAVLDWEAVAVGPRELDLGWLVFFHEYFQRVAVRYGHRGIPDLLRRDDAVAAYSARSGHEVRDFDWYFVYAALRQALTSIRVSSRAVHFGERPAPEDPQELIMQADHLEELLAP
jgi:aminoglycoside phosphotransferase (APT) family kinase protein